MVFIFWGGIVNAQNDELSKNSLEKIWYHANQTDYKVNGINTIEAYKFLGNKKAKKIIVAVIDSGTDFEHEDLNENVWVNTQEIPDNGIDDDKNGYIDDVHGWNFLGNADGENIKKETLEMARLYKKYRKLSKKAEKTKEEKAFCKKYKHLEKKIENEREKTKKELEYANQLIGVYEITDKMLKDYLGKEDYTLEDLEKIEAGENERLNLSVKFQTSMLESGADMDEFEKAKDHLDEKLHYNLNYDYNPRKVIIGDDLSKNDNIFYGNNDIDGDGSEHGTHVAGIIGAVSHNKIGIDGIAPNEIEIMIIRAVPNGDEHDKDVANAIRYAVDNGASVINMSFGKAYSPYKKFVDEAVKYADEKEVLMIHAAGNDAVNIDKVRHYPTKFYEDGTFAKHWITVGASSSDLELEIPAEFSNYGKKEVDVFAPGVDIYSLLPKNKYGKNSGTSMAAPVVSGIAALLMAYYPELSALEVKNIILESAVDWSNQKVNKPTEKKKNKKTKFKKLSSTGSIVNAYKAVKMAAEK